MISECLAIAQKNQIPLIIVSKFPFSPTGEISPAMNFAKTMELGFVNKVLYWGAERLQWAAIGDKVNKFRKELGYVKLFGLLCEILCFHRIMEISHVCISNVLISSACRSKGQ